MDKSRVLELLVRKMAGEANQNELEELKELLPRYSDSVYYEEFLNQLWLKSVEQAPNHPNIEQAYQDHLLKFQNDFSTVEKVIVKLPTRNYKSYYGIALAFSVLFISVFYFIKSDKIQPNIEIVAGKGVRKKIKLPDGTIVWLNSDSKLSYNSNIKKEKKRIVYLVGEAFFDVSHLKSQPFVVRTDKMSVKVLGTAFNVKAYAVDKKAEATLIRGSIELSLNGNSKQKIILTPSEKFVLLEHKKILSGETRNSTSPQDITLLIEHVNPVIIGKQEYIKETSWKDSQLVFKNESFEELKPKLERWFNVQIHMDTPRTKFYRFTGVFKNENIKEALTAMQLIKPFNFKLNANDVIIY